jgi:nucleotide-binding universal stress UspA family protein
VKVLVPIDSSTFSQAATRVAFQIAGSRPNTSLHGIHIVNVRPPSGNVLADLSGYVGFEPAVVSEEVYKAHRDAARALVDGFVSRAATEGVQASGQVVTGPVTGELVKASNHADLVVMGMAGESEDKFPGQGGAQACNALPQFECPVLLVPREVTRLHSLSVGYDGSASAARALRAVARLAGPMDIPVHLMHVGNSEEGQRLLQEAAATLGPTVETHFHLLSDHQSVHQALVEAAAAARSDCLVLGFKGRSTLKDVVFGSAQTHLIGVNNPHVALLVVH